MDSQSSVETLLKSRRRWRIAAITTWAILAVFFAMSILLVRQARLQEYHATADAEHARFQAENEFTRALDAEIRARTNAADQQEEARQNEKKAKELDRLNELSSSEFYTTWNIFRSPTIKHMRDAAEWKVNFL